MIVTNFGTIAVEGANGLEILSNVTTTFNSSPVKYPEAAERQ